MVFEYFYSWDTLQPYITNHCTSHLTHYWIPFIVFYCWRLGYAVMYWNNETLSARRNSSVVLR